MQRNKKQQQWIKFCKDTLLTRGLTKKNLKNLFKLHWKFREIKDCFWISSPYLEHKHGHCPELVSCVILTMQERVISHFSKLHHYISHIRVFLCKQRNKVYWEVVYRCLSDTSSSLRRTLFVRTEFDISPITWT